MFGAAVTGTGWAEARHTFEWLGSLFSNCTADETEVLAVKASSGFAYLVAFEHTTATWNGAPPESYTLRSPP